MEMACLRQSYDGGEFEYCFNPVYSTAWRESFLHFRIHQPLHWVRPEAVLLEDSDDGDDDGSHGGDDDDLAEIESLVAGLGPTQGRTTRRYQQRKTPAASRASGRRSGAAPAPQSSAGLQLIAMSP